MLRAARHAIATPHLAPTCLQSAGGAQLSCAARAELRTQNRRAPRSQNRRAKRASRASQPCASSSKPNPSIHSSGLRCSPEFLNHLDVLDAGRVPLFVLLDCFGQLVRVIAVAELLERLPDLPAGRAVLGHFLLQGWSCDVLDRHPRQSRELPITLLIFCAPCDAFLANWSRFSCDDGPFFVNASVLFAAAAGLRRTTRLGGLVPERGEIMARIQLATKQHDPLEGMHPEDQDAPNMTGGLR